jgi:importin-4
MSSPDKNLRKAGCAVLGIICEGCSDTIRESLPQILPHLLEAVADHEYYVRESACFALGQFSEHCQPEILYHHQSILPVLFGALGDDRPTVQGTSCYVLENFCENLQPHTLAPFLPQLMERLGQVLANQNKVTQEMALAAIAATAVASEHNFLPYADSIVTILRDILFVSEPEMFNIRGRGLECLGHIAVAIGVEHFSPYHDMGLQAAMQGIHIGEDSLKEYSYTYIANCAKVMKNAFDQHLETLVPHLLEVISESELNPYVGEGGDPLDMLDDDEDVGEDDDDNEQFHLTTHEGFVNSKKAALCAISSLADHTGASFYPYLEKTLNTLLHEQNGPLWSFHRLIRAEALVTLQYLVKVACLTYGPITPPEKGQIIEFHPIVKECVIAATTTCINAMVTDVEKLPAAYSIESLESILKLVGMAAMTIMDVESNKSYGDLIMQNILTLLKEKGKSQTVMKHEQDDDDDDDHDNLVMDAVCDLIATLAKVIGEGFLPFFEPMVKPLLKFTKKNRPHSDRAMAIGCFGEVINEVGEVAGDKFAETLFPILRDGVADSMESVRRNAAFCLGILCQRSPTKMTPSCLQVLQWLYPLCVRSTADVVTDVGGADSDNALGAVARMMMSCQGVPLAQVLPVMFNALPLRADLGEGQTVYEAMSFLLRRGDESIYSLLPQVLVLLADVLKEESRYNDLTKVIAIQTIKYLASEKHEMMVGALGHVPGDQQTGVMVIIERAVQS